MKKEYMKPSMKVVELQHKCQILAGSQPGDIHDANPATGGDLIVAHAADLLDGLVLHHLGVADGGIHFALDF